MRVKHVIYELGKVNPEAEIFLAANKRVTRGFDCSGFSLDPLDDTKVIFNIGNREVIITKLPLRAGK